MIAVAAAGICRRYRSRWALTDMSFDIPQRIAGIQRSMRCVATVQPDRLQVGPLIFPHSLASLRPNRRWPSLLHASRRLL
jgi:hypothetical protein